MTVLKLSTKERIEIIDITSLINESIKKEGIIEGAALIYVPHTTAALTINENGDPDVVSDIKKELSKIVPFDDGYKHFEGNSQAHILSSMIGVNINLIIEHGRLVLGRWQSVYFTEFDGPRSREVYVKIIRD